MPTEILRCARSPSPVSCCSPSRSPAADGSARPTSLAADTTAEGEDPLGAFEEEALSGRLSLDGSSTVAPLMSLAAERFRKVEPGVKITVGTSGTGGGFERFCRGETDVSNASRPIKEEEALCAKNGVASFRSRSRTTASRSS